MFCRSSKHRTEIAFCNDGTAGEAWLDVSKSLLSGRNDESPKSIVESGEPIRD
jgi:hypothetical protein